MEKDLITSLKKERDETMINPSPSININNDSKDSTNNIKMLRKNRLGKWKREINSD